MRRQGQQDFYYKAFSENESKLDVLAPQTESTNILTVTTQQ